jgi:hypothetical protein
MLRAENNKRYSPTLSIRISTDEAVIEEGALGALTDHGQGE